MEQEEDRGHLHPKWLRSPWYGVRWIGLIIPCASLAELFLRYESCWSESSPVLADGLEYPVGIGIGFWLSWFFGFFLIGY